MKKLSAAVSAAMHRYACFSGRACREECLYFLMFASFVFLAITGITALDLDAASLLCALANVAGCVFVLLALALPVPLVALTVRRLHDLERSGWYLLLHLLPVIGSVIVLAWCCMQGTRGRNRYGDERILRRRSAVW